MRIHLVARRANQPGPLTADEQTCFDKLPAASRTIPAYLEGRRTLDQAAAELVAAAASRR
jgi:hypothetical protein